VTRVLALLLGSAPALAHAATWVAAPLAADQRVATAGICDPVRFARLLPAELARPAADLKDARSGRVVLPAGADLIRIDRAVGGQSAWCTWNYGPKLKARIGTIDPAGDDVLCVIRAASGEATAYARVPAALPQYLVLTPARWPAFRPLAPVELGAADRSSARDALMLELRPGCILGAPGVGGYRLQMSDGRNGPRESATPVSYRREGGREYAATLGFEVALKTPDGRRFDVTITDPPAPVPFTYVPVRKN
jgi:hypothetical protein